ncbi:hypothetical protein DL93DRAFT_2075663 [Clavulina sp. PMI_390]|nr:hypothetical protein DL93DRAFT_2075663 [Clavulina sp. PMI_390]
MYSSLFAAGLAQCWEAESPAASPPPASTAFVATHKPHLSAASTASAPTTSTSSYPSSFFAFDSSSKPSKRPSARKDAAVASEASMLASEFQDYTRARSPSPSRFAILVSLDHDHPC